MAVGHTVVGLDIHRDHLEAVAAGHTDLVQVAAGHNLVEVHQEERRSLEVAADQEEHRNLAAAVDHILAEAADRSLAEVRRIDRAVHRNRQVLGWSSRPWSRSSGQWHQEVA